MGGRGFAFQPKSIKRLWKNLFKCLWQKLLSWWSLRPNYRKNNIHIFGTLVLVVCVNNQPKKIFFRHSYYVCINFVCYHFDICVIKINSIYLWLPTLLVAIYLYISIPTSIQFHFISRGNTRLLKLLSQVHSYTAAMKKS